MTRSEEVGTVSGAGSLNIAVVTLFPAMLDALRAGGVAARAAERGLFTVAAYNPRNFASDRHRTVDDRPFGGGPGMVMMFEPMYRAIEAARAGAGGAPPANGAPQPPGQDARPGRGAPPRRLPSAWSSCAAATRGWTSGSSRRPSTRRFRSETSC